MRGKAKLPFLIVELVAALSPSVDRVTSDARPGKLLECSSHAHSTPHSTIDFHALNPPSSI
jgi:hypothetical protein